MNTRGEPSGELVHILAWRLLEYSGNSLSYGGVQRWIIELARLLRAKGHPVLVHQRADHDFERIASSGLWVRGTKASARAAGSPWFNARVHRSIPDGAPVVYMSEDVAYPVCRPRSVVVQHGVWWDGEYGWWKARAAERIARHAVRASAATICVDTNFINWLRARYPDAGLDGKLHYAANFIDPEQWGEQPAEPAAAALRDGRLSICFPRRSEPRRGIYLMADVAPRLAQRFPHVDFRFVVGSGYHTEALRQRLTESGLDSARWSLEVLPFERMSEAYQDSAIVVVPTLCGEGTSLSAIEAMYFGCALVTTWVGGLANLVQDGHNGLLVAPVAEALEEGLARLIEDSALRTQLGRNAMSSAVPLYGIERWRARVGPLLDRALALRAEESASVA